MKLFVPEPGSGAAIEAWNGANRVISSVLLYPESRAAVGRAARSRRLGARELTAARRQLESLWRDVDRIAVTERLAREAGELAELGALRAYDAVHLASLLDVGDPDTVLVAGDAALLDAARGHRFATVAVV